MKKILTLLFACAVVCSLLSPVTALAKKGSKSSTPKERAYVGSISDSMCGKKHNMHNGSARECAQKCVKGGGKYVFVRGANVYEIVNQDFGGLEEHAGEKVRLTGTMSADHKSITVTQITIPESAKKAS